MVTPFHGALQMIVRPTVTPQSYHTMSRLRGILPLRTLWSIYTAMSNPKPEPPEYLQHITDPKHKAFLIAYGNMGSIAGAAESANIPVGTCYRWVNPGQGTYTGVQAFKEGFEKAKRAFGDTLEKLAWSRVTDPTGNRGSDVLLLALMNANMPEKYRPNVVLPDPVAKDILAEMRRTPWKRRQQIDDAKAAAKESAVQEATDIVGA